MSTTYYTHKVKSAFLSRVATPLGNRFKAPGRLAGEIGAFRFAGKFILYFADPPLIHLGDQLFHQPLINLLGKMYDIRVALADSHFSPFYTAQGLRTIVPEEYAQINGAVIITKEDLAHSVSTLFPNGNLFLGFNYRAIEESERITVLLTKLVFEMLDHWKIAHPPLPERMSDAFRPYVPTQELAAFDGAPWLSELAENAGTRWAIFNDFVSSGYVQAARRQNLLHDVARRRKDAGDRLVYVGTQADRSERPTAPEFIDLDIRGAFGPLGLYKLFSLPNVRAAVTYDTFVMHVASAYCKDLYIVARNTSDADHLKGRYIPMYPGAESTVKLCM